MIILSYKRLVVILFLDFVIFALLILLFTYFGMSHVIFTLVGLLILLLGVYDISTGQLSKMVALLLGLPIFSGVSSKILNYLPVLISLGLLVYSLPQFWYHGLINDSQQRVMQQAHLSSMALGLLAACLLITLLASIIYFRDTRKK